VRKIHILAAAMALVAASSALAQTVTSTRETAYDVACCDDAGCTVSTTHQRLDTAIVACVNKSLEDGKARWVQGGRYRITSSSAPSPVLTCSAPQPAAQTRTQSCPSGTTGTWQQTSAYVCASGSWGPGSIWTPTNAPAGACTPVVSIRNSATLRWTAPAGTPAPDGYRVRYGRNSGSIDQMLDVAGTSALIEGLAAGNWYFEVHARSGDTEGLASNVVTKTIT
jgi:hypothetical protein